MRITIVATNPKSPQLLSRITIVENNKANSSAKDSSIIESIAKASPSGQRRNKNSRKDSFIIVKKSSSNIGDDEANLSAKYIHTNLVLVKRTITPNNYSKVNPKVMMIKKKKNLVIFPKVKKKKDQQHPQEIRFLTLSLSTVNSFVNAYDILSTTDNGDSIDELHEMGSKEIKSTQERTITTTTEGNGLPYPVTGIESERYIELDTKLTTAKNTVITYVI